MYVYYLPSFSLAPTPTKVTTIVKGGHQSDNIGTILAVADPLARKGERVTVKDVLKCMRSKVASRCSTRSIMSASTTSFSKR
jgi:hypothetical protein